MALVSHISERNFKNSLRWLSLMPSVTSCTMISLWATISMFSPVSWGTEMRASNFTSLFGQAPQFTGRPMPLLTSAHFWQVDGTTGRVFKILMPAARMSLLRPFFVSAHPSGFAGWNCPSRPVHSRDPFSCK